MGILFLILIGILSVCYLFLRRRMNYWQSRGIVCEPPSLFLGNFDGVGTHIHFAEKFRLIYDKYKFDNDMVGFYFMQSPRLMPLSPDLIKSILIKDFNHFADRGVYHNEKDDPLSAHLFAIEGEKWKRLRNKLSATFTSGKMKMMYDTVDSFSKPLIELVESKNVGIDVKRLCVRYTADVIGSIAFGLECNALKDDNAEMMLLADAFDFKKTKDRLNFFIANTFRDFAKWIGLKITPQKLTDFFIPVIKQTVEYREKHDIQRNDFMSLLLQIKKYGKLKDEETESVGGLTMNELTAQAFIFFVAGFETSSTTMNYCLYELAYHQEIQERLRQEINNVIKKHDGKITYEALMEMTYLDQVINESLRLYSPVSALFRICIQDYKIPNTDKIIEKGTGVIIPVYGLHLDYRYYKEPQLFNPDRFTPEEVKKRPNMAFLPFGDGNRNCIGMRFALLQTKLGIATLVKNFNLKLNKKCNYPITLNPLDILMTTTTPILIDAEKI